MRVWSRQFTLDFIEVLRLMPWLWDMRHSEYRLLSARQRGYERLLKKAQEADPTATLGDVKRKLKCLRTNLRKIERRVSSFRRLNLDYTPSLFYYKPLSFLLEHTKPVGKMAAVSERRASDASGSEDSEENTCSDTVTTLDEDCEVFGQYVAVKLVSINNLQRIYLEKIINDAIYEAELGNLTASTRLCTEELDNGVVMQEFFVRPTNASHQSVTQVHNSITELHSYCLPHPDIVQVRSANIEQRIDQSVSSEAVSLTHQSVSLDRAVLTHQSISTDQAVASLNHQSVTLMSQSISKLSPVKVELESNELESPQVFIKTEYNSKGEPHYVLQRLNDKYSLPSGAVLQKVDSEKIHLVNRNGVITIDNNAETDSQERRKGVVMENGNSDTNLRCIVVDNSVGALRNVQFADDDDIMKMCEDDGITIISVEPGEAIMS